MIESKNSQLSENILKDLNILDVFRNDYGLKVHGRSVSKMILKNQKTVSLKLKNLETKGILKSEQKGKIKEYFLNLDSPLFSHCMSIIEESVALAFIMKHQRFCDLYHKLIDFFHGPILIFGSFARGNNVKESDIDILLLGDYDKQKLERILSLYPFEVHVIHMTLKQFERGLLKKESFMLEILENHIILQGSSLMVNIFRRFYR